MHFEQGDYEAAVADCDKAVERGRELRADYKLVGKALTRKANALVRLTRLEDAIAVYHKALTEHRSSLPPLLALLPCLVPWQSAWCVAIPGSGTASQLYGGACWHA